MFLNVSNHPSCKWGMEQKNAASRYGNIEDLPFPEIDPSWTTEEVETCARKYFDLCRDRIGNERNSSAVHLAGEPVFCFLLAQLLLQNGYLCLTSTTERKVVEKGNVKQSVFEFSGFRNYKLISYGR